MLTKATLQEQLRRLASTAAETAKALGNGADPPALDLAAGAVDLDRLQTRLEKIAGRLNGLNGKGRKK